MSMTTNEQPRKRALLIGCTAKDLSGVENDIGAVGRLLAQLGFSCTFCVGAEATRARIVAEFEALGAKAQAGDCICIYYSGHGGLAINPNHSRYGGAGTWQGRREPETYHYIAPVDIRDSSDGEFRGIFSAELSAWVAKLTHSTPDVTVVLDCCHATGAVRLTEYDYRAKAIARPWRMGIGSHVASLRKHGYDLTVLCPEGSPNVVQLVACQASKTAYEYTTSDGTRHGLMTAMWLRAMAEQSGRRVSWSALGGRIHELVREQLPAQRATVVGPVERTVFGGERRHQPGVLIYSLEGERPILRGGALHGVAVGDRYLVMPLEAGSGLRSVAFAEAVVTDVHSQLSEVVLFPPEAVQIIPRGARGFLIERPSRRYCVSLTGGVAPGSLRAAISDSPLLSVAIEGAGDSHVNLHVEGSRWEVRDRRGVTVRHPFLREQAQPKHVIDAVEHVARAEAMRTFQAGIRTQRLTTNVQINWGVVGSEAAEVIDAGSRLYVHAHHAIKQKGVRPIYISVLGIAVDATISLLSQATPQGREVFGDTTYTLGEDALGKLVGIPIAWSPLVPRDGPRRAALVVIATDMPVDMRPLVTGTWPHAARCACGPEQVLPAPVRATRSVGRGASTRSARVAVRVFEFWVRP